MNNIGPLLITFAFFAILFLIGKRLQSREKKNRLEKRTVMDRAVMREDRIMEQMKKEREGSQGQVSGLGQGLGGEPASQTGRTYNA